MGQLLVEASIPLSIYVDLERRANKIIQGFAVWVQIWPRRALLQRKWGNSLWTQLCPNVDLCRFEVAAYDWCEICLFYLSLETENRIPKFLLTRVAREKLFF